MKPVCKKCGEKHWRFVPCAEATAVNERDEAKAKVEAQKRNVEIVWRVPAGFHTFQGHPRAVNPNSGFHVNEFTHPRPKQPPEAA